MTDRERIAHLTRALESIANPIAYLRAEAESQGARLNGCAYQLANDPHFLKKLAKDALTPQGKQE
jgi:hypothetical protein